MGNKNKLNTILKIAAPVIIIAVIASIFIFKNTGDDILDKDSDMSFIVTSIDMEEIKSHNLPILINFGAESCVPCQKMYPSLVKVSEDMQGKAVIRYIDVWKYPEGAQDFPVQVVPTQAIFTSDGKPYVPSEDIGINFIMYSSRDTDEHVYTIHEGGLTESEMKNILADMGVET